MEKIEESVASEAEDARVSRFSLSFQYVCFYFQHSSGLPPYDAYRSRTRTRTKGSKGAEAMRGRRLQEEVGLFRFRLPLRSAILRRPSGGGGSQVYV